MLDITIIRENPDMVQGVASTKGVEIDIPELLRIDEQRRSLQQEADELRAKRNQRTASQKSKPSEATIQEGKELKERLGEIEKKLRLAEQKYRVLIERVPNIPTEDTPVGKSEEENVCLRQVGEKSTFSFSPAPHYELGETSGCINTKRAAQVSGSRFAYLMGDLVLLQFALIRFVLETVTNSETLQSIISGSTLDVSNKPFIPVLPPCMVRPDILRAMARLEPKEDRYYIPEDDLFLAGSAEHTLGPFHAEETLSEKDMPIRYIGFSTAFRREAGAHGKDVRGILRMHQFDKMEMESFTLPEDGVKEQEFLVAIQEYLMRQLEIPYQVVLKCTADMGIPNARAIDIESWLPGQDRYRETHTADYMSDYQSRRLGTRIRKGESVFLAHMNDATALAMGRTIIAIMENNQTKNGSIQIPKVLLPYMMGKTMIGNDSMPRSE